MKNFIVVGMSILFVAVVFFSLKAESNTTAKTGLGNLAINLSQVTVSL